MRTHEGVGAIQRKEEISSYNKKPLSRKAAIANIERALGVIFRSRQFNRSPYSYGY